MKYAYYPGCSLSSTAKEYDMSTRAVCEALGIELVEIPDWNCCGASSAHSMNHELGLALPLRDLAKAEEMGLDVIAPCAACFNRMKAASLARGSSVKVLSLLEVIDSLGAEKIKSLVKRDLSALKPACYYGCLLVRPKEVGFDDPENPMSLDRIMAALGAGPVDWPHKNECCGAGLSLSKPEIVVKLAGDILAMAKLSGANCVATACPLCQGNLDMRQTQAEQARGEKFGLPVFYFTQLLGLAFGLPEKSLGLERLMVDPRPALTEVRA
ncbi:MAG: CoB--CoM heterodisulfide reductase iron-sulfur subunit B family protein [Armatimonadota bacterium]